MCREWCLSLGHPRTQRPNSWPEASMSSSTNTSLLPPLPSTLTLLLPLIAVPSSSSLIGVSFLFVFIIYLTQFYIVLFYCSLLCDLFALCNKSLIGGDIDLTVMLNHSWTYQALIHDLLNMQLNRVIVPVI